MGLGPFVVAIDGPSGAGKSSVSREVAKILGAKYLDTGAIYRAFCWWCLSQEVDLGSEEQIVGALTGFVFEVSVDPCEVLVTVGGVDVSKQIRGLEVSAAVSLVSANGLVRQVLVGVQQQLVGGVESGVVVVEGRDIGSVVFPNAPVRLFLTASESVRVLRRGKQLGEGSLDDVVGRDGKDFGVSGFDPQVLGIPVVDSTDLTFRETVEVVLGCVRQVLDV